MSNNKSPRKATGVSLVEILVSTVIFALIMGGLINLFVATKRISLHTGSRMKVGELGRYFLDPLQADVRQDEWGSNCLSTDGINTNCDPTLLTPMKIDDVLYTPEYEKSPVIAELRKVELTIRWQESPP